MTSEEKLTMAVTPKVLEDFYNQKVAPFLNSSGATHYSTEEQVVGTWIDSKPIYQKTVNCGALPNNTTKDITIATANTILVKHWWGYALRTSDGMSLELPRSNPTLSNNISVDIIENQSKIRITTGGDYSTFEECYITLQYTKTTDA